MHDNESFNHSFLIVMSFIMMFVLAAIIAPSPAHSHESLTHIDPVVKAGCAKLEDKIEDTIYLHLHEASTHARQRYLDSFSEQYESLTKLYNKHCLPEEVFEDAGNG